MYGKCMCTTGGISTVESTANRLSGVHAVLVVVFVVFVVFGGGGGSGRTPPCSLPPASQPPAASLPHAALCSSDAALGVGRWSDRVTVSVNDSIDRSRGRPGLTPAATTHCDNHNAARQSSSAVFAGRAVTKMRATVLLLLALWIGLGQGERAIRKHTQPSTLDPSKVNIDQPCLSSVPRRLLNARWGSSRTQPRRR